MSKDEVNGRERLLHNILDPELERELVFEELWRQMSRADKYATQGPLYGGMWIREIIREAEDILSRVDNWAVMHGVGDDVELKLAAAEVKKKLAQLEYDEELIGDPEDL